ncbi:MAG TPA: hypothetical protein VGO25_11220 [Rhodanobacteraceae bacterium]|jgi:hypothetical protein|nr:hypothetical protein [Rhodanobacteraceae bacterium]
MLDDAKLQLLGEMGIDVYVSRSARMPSGAAAISQATPTANPAPTGAREGVHARVALVARVQGSSESVLLAQAQRALAFAQVDSVIGDAAESRDFINNARGLVVFGKSLARDVGSALPADRAKCVHWISAAEVASIVGNSDAKRALWSELRRMIRSLRNKESDRES